mgnify:CR=1 FL=1
MGRWKRKWESYFSLKNKEGSHMKKWNLYIHRTDCERSFFFFFNQKLKEYVQKLILEEIAVTNHNMFTWGTWVNDLVVKQPARAKRIPIAGNTSLLVDVLINRCMFRSHLLYQFRRRGNQSGYQWHRYRNNCHVQGIWNWWSKGHRCLAHWCQL